MPPAVAVDLLELDGSLVAHLSENRQVRKAGGSVDIEGLGDGDVAVDHDHPNVAALTTNRVVRVTETAPDPRKRFEFLIDERRTAVKPSSKADADRVVTVSGFGLLAVLARVRTLGTMPVGARPQSSRRLWGAAAPEMPRGSWGTPFVQTRATSSPRRPWGMPSEYAEWLWTRAEPGSPSTDHPIEGGWFHTQFTVAAETDVLFLQTADDSFRQFLQGVELQLEEREYPADVWHWPYTAGCRLAAGTYDYVVYAHNDAGRGAQLAEIWETGPAGISNPLRLSGGTAYPIYGTWRCLIQDDDDPYPGCTPGLILRAYHAEGLARPEPEGGDFTFMFTDTHDSYGEPWATALESEYSNEGDLLDVFEAMTEVSIDGWAELGADGVEIFAVNKGTRGVSESFTVAPSAVLSHEVIEVDEIENSVLVVSEKGPRLVEHAASIAVNGARPGGKLNAAKIHDPHTQDAMGLAYLEPRSTVGESRIFEITPMDDFNAQPGAVGTVDGVSGLRLAKVAYDFEKGGRLRKVPNVETPYQRALRDSERRLDRIERESGEMGSVRIIDSGTGIKTGRLNSVKLCSWGFDVAEDLEHIEWDLPDEPGWRRYKVEEKARLCRVEIEADWAEPDGAGGHTKVTDGVTTVQLLINSQPLPAGVFLVSIGENDTNGYAELWGEALIYPGQTLSIGGWEYGGHINGTVTLYATDPL